MMKGQKHHVFNQVQQDTAEQNLWRSGKVDTKSLQTGQKCSLAGLSLAQIRVLQNGFMYVMHDCSTDQQCCIWAVGARGPSGMLLVMDRFSCVTVSAVCNLQDCVQCCLNLMHQPARACLLSVMEKENAYEEKRASISRLKRISTWNISSTIVGSHLPTCLVTWSSPRLSL